MRSPERKGIRIRVMDQQLMRKRRTRVRIIALQLMGNTRRKGIRVRVMDLQIDEEYELEI
jgi:hypothetical protein